MSTPNNLPTEDRHPTVDYERTDVSVRAVVGLFLSVLLGVGLVQLGLAELLRYFQADARRHDPQQSPLVESGSRPPAPRLQEHPLRDYQELVTVQEEKLGSYGWNDRRKKTVHIPITRAMDLIVERGMPATSKPGEAPSDNEPAAEDKKKPTN